MAQATTDAIRFCPWLSAAIVNPVPPRFGRRLVVGRWLSLLLLLSLTGACGVNPLPRKTLILYVETGEGGYGLKRSDTLAGNRAMMEEIIKQFQAVYPDTNISPHFPEGDEIVEDVRKRHSRGLGPDLMLTRLSTAVDLNKAGLTEQVDASALNLDEIKPSYVSGYRKNGEIYGVPIALAPQVACFDRRRISQSPDSVAELVSLAASGVPIGLPMGIRDNYWTSTGVGAQRILAGLFGFQSDTSPATISAAEKQSFVDWLTWLKVINLQKNISFFRSIDDLDRMFQQGELVWIPCRGPSLRGHIEQMGDQLGVAPLPGNGGKPAITINVVYVFTFGPHSSGDQRKSAAEFVSFMLSRFVQRELMLENTGVMPVNDDILIPVKSSKLLDALDQSVQDGLTLSPSTPGIPQHLEDQITDNIQSVILGTITERQATDRLINLQISQ